MTADEALTKRSEVDAAVLPWIQSNHQILLIEGPPGCGKTSWVKLFAGVGSVCDAGGLQLAKVVAHHYCSRYDTRSGSAVHFLEKLAQGLAANDSGFALAFLAKSGQRRMASLEIEIDQAGAINPSAIGAVIHNLILRQIPLADLLHEIMDPLEVVLTAPGPDCLVVVDAPDEPSTTDVAELLLALGNMPRRLRWIITARSGTSFVERMANSGCGHLDLRAIAADGAAVAKFVSERAKSLGLLDRLPSGLADQMFVDALVERAGGNFLVARCALDALAATQGLIDLAVVAALPRKLAAFYLDFMHRLIDDAEWKRTWLDSWAPVVGSLAVAKDGIAEEELAILTGLREDVVGERLSRLGSYVVRGPSGFRFFHATFAEFLLDKVEARKFHCPESLQHARFLSWIESYPAWSDVPAYGLVNYVGHVVSAALPGMADQLDQTAGTDFVIARLDGGAEPYAFISDFRLALETCSSQGWVDRTLFWTLALAHWQDRAGMSSGSATTTLLAVTGQCQP